MYSVSDMYYKSGFPQLFVSKFFPFEYAFAAPTKLCYPHVGGHSLRGGLWRGK
jgi:hypothetical protein